MTEVEYLTDKDFDHITLKYDEFSIVECVNGNNGQLLVMQSVISKLINNMPVSLRHFRIDMLKYPFVVEQFYVLNRTAYLLFFNGQFIDRIDGIISYNDFSRRLNVHINASTKIKRND
jgi:hypothetical protein